MKAQIDHLTECLHQCVDQVRFTLEPNDVVDSNCYKDILVQASWSDGRARLARTVRPTLDEYVRNEFLDCMRWVLSKFIDKDEITHRVPMAGVHGIIGVVAKNGVRANTYISSVTSFGNQIIKIAASIGAERVVKLLMDWSNGEPMKFRTCMIANATIRSEINGVAGITLTPLPLSSRQLSNSLPSGENIVATNFLGRTLLTVETTIEPVLLDPESSYIGSSCGVKFAECYSVDMIWETLAVLLGKDVSTPLSWYDYYELANPACSYLSGIGTQETLPRVRGWWTESTTTDGHVGIELRQECQETIAPQELQQTLTAIRHSRRKVRVGIQRWIRSLRVKADIVDRFIDLRLTLESLLLPNGTIAEFRFKLSLAAAWFISADPDERNEIFDIVKAAYDYGSKAIHSGNVEDKNGRRDAHEILMRAQEICHAIIRRTLRDGPVEDLKSLVLNLGNSNNSED